MNTPAMKAVFSRRIAEVKYLIQALFKGDAVNVKVWAGKHPKYYKSLRNVYGRLRNLRRLSVLDVVMIVVLYPLRLLLAASYHLWVVFFLMLEMIDVLNPFRYRGTPLSDSAAEKRLQEVLATLRRDGVAIWRDFFSDMQCDKVNRYLDELMIRNKDGFDRLPREIEGFKDPVFAGFEHTREIVEAEFKAYGEERMSFVYNRARVRVYETPESLHDIFENEVISELAARYLGHTVGHKRALLEELKPSLLSDPWHVDNSGNSFKMMLLTEDCCMDNGPLRYKIGTHKGGGSLAKLRVNWLMLKFGYTFSALNILEYRTLPDDQVVWGTGKKGDVIFFDPSGIHSGSRAISGRRRSVVIPKTPRKIQNKILGWLGVVAS
jgi:hypothetical protein